MEDMKVGEWIQPFVVMDVLNPREEKELIIVKNNSILFYQE